MCIHLKYKLVMLLMADEVCQNIYVMDTISL